MDKNLFDELLLSVKEAGEINRGEQRASRTFRYSPVNVKKLRKDLGLSQSQFSRIVSVSIKTLQNWEQGRRKPQGPALVLLTILKNDPKHAMASLH